jgi:diacylglycerol kinase (ATP)
VSPGPREDGFVEARPKRRALMLVNRMGTRARSRLDDGLRILAGGGIETEPELLRTPEHVAALIRERAADCELVILGGGDGTLSRALDALLAAGRPLGILPMGNANDLARTLGIPTDFSGACRVIAQGGRRRIDVGWVNGTHFFNVASMGLGVHIAHRLTRERKQRWGVLAYLGSAWEAIREQRSFRVGVVCDGLATELRAMQVAVGNGRHYGGGMTIADDAAIDDGRLDLYALPSLPVWRLLMILPILRWGLHRPIESILSLRGGEIRVEPDRPLEISVDGEVRGRAPAHFRVVPLAIEVFVPATAPQSGGG